MESKKWYTSKTLIVNVIAIIGIILNYFYGIELDAELQATLATAVLGVINIALRLVTSKRIG